MLLGCCDKLNQPAVEGCLGLLGLLFAGERKLCYLEVFEGWRKSFVFAAALVSCYVLGSRGTSGGKADVAARYR